MISEHVPCQKLVFTLNLTFYVLLIHRKYLYINLHGGCMGRNHITEKCFYWMPNIRGNQSIYLIRQNTMKASAFLMMMVAVMILMIYVHNTHTFWDISVEKYHLHAVLTVLHGTADCVNCAKTEHQVHIAWNVTGSPRQMLFCLLWIAALNVT